MSKKSKDRETVQDRLDREQLPEPLNTMYRRGYLKGILDISNSIDLMDSNENILKNNLKSKKQFVTCLKSLMELLKTNGYARDHFRERGGLMGCELIYFNTTKKEFRFGDPLKKRHDINAVVKLWCDGLLTDDELSDKLAKIDNVERRKCWK